MIGRQVSTDYGGCIDLLCLDREGDIVVVELKRGMTPREVTAQVLDYASWVKDLSRERIVALADQYLQKFSLTLEQAFQNRFLTELPDTLNSAHSMFVVGSQIDPSTERIITYLSEAYGVGINAATYQFFKDNEQEFLGRVFLLKPSQVERRAQSKGMTKHKQMLSFEDLMTIAAENGVDSFYQSLSSALEKCLKKSTTRSSLKFEGAFNGSKKVIFSLIPSDSDADKGLKFQIYINRFTEFFKVPREQVLSFLPATKKDWVYASSKDPDWAGYEGYFQREDEVKAFIAHLKKLYA